MSLQRCRGQAIVAPPQQVPMRLDPVIIEGTAEKEPAAEDSQAGTAEGGTRNSDQDAASGGMLASLIPASLMLPMPGSVGPLLAAAPTVPFVRIAPAQPEITPDDLAALARLQLAAQASGGRPAADSILALAPRSYVTRYDQLIADAARRHAVDPLLLHAVVKQESHYGAHVISRAGAIGLMQIMPATGARFGQSHGALFDPARNLDTGARLLRALHARYRGDLDLMLAAYNAGEGAVSRYGNRVPPFRETRDYVQRVKAHYVTLASENGFAELSL